MKLEKKSLVIPLAFSALAFLFSLLLIFAHKDDFARVEFLRSYGVPALHPIFSDLQVVTAGIESLHHGYDPLLKNPYDVFGRPMNYPRIWQNLLGIFSINRSSTNYIGVALIIIFLIANYSIHFGQNIRTNILIFFAQLSPIVLLLIERGNIDIFIYLLILGALLCLKKNYDVVAFVLFIFAGFLKLYPIVLLPIIWLYSPTKRSIYLVCYGILIFLGYLVLYHNEMLAVSNATPRPIQYAYGQFVLTDYLSSQYNLYKLKTIIRVLTYLAILVLAASAWINKVSLKSREIFAINKSDIFLTGGSMIYLGTFMIGNNWDYRLGLLLLMIPGLSTIHLSASKNRFSWIYFLPIGMLLFIFFQYPLYNIFRLFSGKNILFFIAKEILCWALFGWCLFHVILKYKVQIYSNITIWEQIKVISRVLYQKRHR